LIVALWKESDVGEFDGGLRRRPERRRNTCGAVRAARGQQRTADEDNKGNSPHESRAELPWPVRSS
jgi:hypothetical protein